MGYMERYIAEEHASDYKSGRISHQELLRRLTLLTRTAMAALVLVASLGCSAATFASPMVPAATSTLTAAFPVSALTSAAEV